MNTPSCPKHGTERVKQNSRGWYCAKIIGKRFDEDSGEEKSVFCKLKPVSEGAESNGMQQAPRQTQRPAAPADPSIEGKVCTLIIEAFISSTRTVQWLMENESWLFQYAMKHRMPSFEDALEERWEHVPPDEPV